MNEDPANKNSAGAQDIDVKKLEESYNAYHDELGYVETSRSKYCGLLEKILDKRMDTE